MTQLSSRLGWEAAVRFLSLRSKPLAAGFNARVANAAITVRVSAPGLAEVEHNLLPPRP